MKEKIHPKNLERTVEIPPQITLRRPESFFESLKASVLWRGVDRVASLLKHIVVAGVIGLSAQLDVFYLAVSLLGVLVFSWGHLLDVLAIPRLVELNREGDNKAFNQLSGGMFLICLAWGGILCGIIFLSREWLSHIPAGLDPQRRALLKDSFFWFLPVILLFVPLRFLGAVFRSIRRFSLFYQGEALIAIVAFVLVLVFPKNPRVLLWSFSIGVMIAFIYLLAQSYGEFSLYDNFWSPEVRKVLKIAPGILVLQSANYLYQLSDALFVSFLPTGSVGALAYGWSLAAIVPSLLSPGIGFLTVFSEKRTSGQSGAEVFNDLVSLALLVGVSFAIFIFVFGDRLVELLLERGIFSSHDTHLTAQALICYALGIVPVLLISPCNQIFQVINRIDLQVKRVILGLICNVLLNGFSLFYLKWGVWGIALATSISYLIMLGVSLRAIGQQKIEIHWTRHLRWLIIISTVCTGAGWAISHVSQENGSPWLVVVHGILFFLLVAIAVLFVPLHEVKLVRKYLMRLIPTGLG